MVLHSQNLLQPPSTLMLHEGLSIRQVKPQPRTVSGLPRGSGHRATLSSLWVTSELARRWSREPTANFMPAKHRSTGSSFLTSQCKRWLWLLTLANQAEGDTVPICCPDVVQPWCGAALLSTTSLRVALGAPRLCPCQGAALHEQRALPWSHPRSSAGELC